MIEILKTTCPDNTLPFTNITIQNQIKIDFFGICYLCEEHTRHTEIDHFYPQKYFPHLENEWDNLFLICEKCNKIKPKNANTSSISELLNVAKDKVESILLLNIDPKTHKIDIVINTFDITLQRKAIYTKEVLDKIYNGVSTTSFSYIDLRKLIIDEINRLIGLLEKYDKLPKFRSYYEKQIAECLSKKSDKVESSFVSFKRNWLKSIPKYKYFEKYFD